MIGPTFLLSSERFVTRHAGRVGMTMKFLKKDVGMNQSLSAPIVIVGAPRAAQK
jgi:hypothetical protein